jgi:small subunit ribosomal protein S15
MISKEVKAKVIKDYARNDKDVGSPEVQIALLSARISDLSEHLKTHVKDNSTRRGLMTMVNQRRTLLAYMKKNEFVRYSELIKRLGLRH